MKSATCKGAKCRAKVTEAQVESQSGYCNKCFTARMRWAEKNHSKDCQARDFYDKHWRPNDEDWEEPEPSLIVDENGQEVTLRNYLTRLWRG